MNNKINGNAFVRGLLARQAAERLNRTGKLQGKEVIAENSTQRPLPTKKQRSKALKKIHRKATIKTVKIGLHRLRAKIDDTLRAIAITGGFMKEKASQKNEEGQKGDIARAFGVVDRLLEKKVADIVLVKNQEGKDIPVIKVNVNYYRGTPEFFETATQVPFALFTSLAGTFKDIDKDRQGDPYGFSKNFIPQYVKGEDAYSFLIIDEKMKALLPHDFREKLEIALDKKQGEEGALEFLSRDENMTVETLQTFQIDTIKYNEAIKKLQDDLQNSSERYSEKELEGVLQKVGETLSEVHSKIGREHQEKLEMECVKIYSTLEPKAQLQVLGSSSWNFVNWGNLLKAESLTGPFMHAVDAFKENTRDTSSAKERFDAVKVAGEQFQHIIKHLKKEEKAYFNDLVRIHIGYAKLPMDLKDSINRYL